MDDLREILLPLFRQECSEHVETLTGDLLSIERQIKANAEISQDSLSSAFRAAHSLKGAAGAIVVKPIEAAMHVVEDVLSRWRDGSQEPTPVVVTAILMVLDAVSATVASDFDGTVTSAQEQGLESAASELAVCAQPGIPSQSGSSSQDMVASGEQVIDPPTTSNSTVSRESEPEAVATSVTADELSPVAVADAEPEPTTEPEPVAGAVVQTEPVTGAKLSTIRVESSKLDRLVTQSGELTVARHRLAERAKQVRQLRTDFSLMYEATAMAGDAGLARVATGPGDQVLLAPQLADFKSRITMIERTLQDDEHAITRVANSIEEQTRQLTMLPFSTITAGLTRVVRDVAANLGKDVQLTVIGADVEIDRGILEAIRDPLNHLIRNSIDHGIETAQARVAAGKPATATVTVSAKLAGGRVQVQVRDDGKGLDEAAIRARALTLNLPPDVANLPVDILVTIAGFSSRSEVTDVSGRGVGMDVVKTQVESLRGELTIESEPGSGLSVTMALPMSLATVRAVLVSCAGSLIALPASGVAALLTVKPEDVSNLGGQRVVSYGGELIKVHSLTHTMGYPSTNTTGLVGLQHLAVLTDGKAHVAFVVDAFTDEREVLIRDLGPHLRGINCLLGASVMSDGAICLIAHPAELIRRVSSNAKRFAMTVDASTESEGRRRVLVTDDAVTTRTLIKAVLESAGFDVETAVNGEDALSRLETDDFELLVSDIEMPIMDGLTLTAKVRSSTKIAHLPVILVSSVAPEQATVRAAEVGADAFVPKGEFSDDVLVDTARNLLAVNAA